MDTAAGRLYLAVEQGMVVRLAKAEEGECRVCRGTGDEEPAREGGDGTRNAAAESAYPDVADTGRTGKDGMTGKNGMGRDGAGKDETGTGKTGGLQNGADAEVLGRALRQIREYMEGRREAFDIPLRLSGTPFQKKVWEALCTIPYGETRTYGEIARQVGSPKGARAVGAACGSNPVMILVPCHRVVGSTGKLVGFGGGLSMKEHLLALEGRKGR